MGSIPGSGRSSRGGHGNPLQYSCLEKPMDRGARLTAVHRDTQSWTRLSDWTEMSSLFWHSLSNTFSSVIYENMFSYFLPFRHFSTPLPLCGGGGLVTQSYLTLMTPWTVVYQAPLSMGFSRQEYWSGLLWPPPGDLPDPEIKLKSHALQADS